MEEASRSVVWLRLIEGEGAALFETTLDGKPLGFGFGPWDAVALLCRAGAGGAVVAFALEEEVAGLDPGDFEIGAPWCLVGESGGCRWARVPPPSESAASAALAVVLDRDDGPFEPFERTARGLSLAVAEPEVLSLFEIAGLHPLVMLESRLVAGMFDATGGEGDASKTSADPPAPAGFAERIWAALVAGERRKASKRDLEWPAGILPFQREGVGTLLRMDRLLLSDDMGLGKTVQAVAAIRILRSRRELRSCLVVAPAGLLDQWRREIARWSPELSAIIVRGLPDQRAWQWEAEKDVVLASYETLRADVGRIRGLVARRGAWGAVVLDEAQRIKNRNETSDAAKSVPRLRSWALTGTPMENDEEELASLLEFVDGDGRGANPKYAPGLSLRERHREVQLRRRKADVLEDLPPKLVTRLTIPLAADQRSSYDRAQQDGIVFLRSLGAEVAVRHVLELIDRLKQICNADPRTDASSKLADIRERLGTLVQQGHKALVFSQYTNDRSGVTAAARHLADFHPLTLTGEMPPAERPQLVRRFRESDRHQVLVISLRAGGVGLNLQEASYVFHLDRWWNPAVERQAEDRTHRMGQEARVHVIKYTCEGTIEQRIEQILDRKQELFDRLVDDVSLDLAARLTRDELLGLFDLS